MDLDKETEDKPKIKALTNIKQWQPWTKAIQHKIKTNPKITKVAGYLLGYQNKQEYLDQLYIKEGAITEQAKAEINKMFSIALDVSTGLINMLTDDAVISGVNADNLAKPENVRLDLEDPRQLLQATATFLKKHINVEILAEDTRDEIRRDLQKPGEAFDVRIRRLQALADNATFMDGEQVQDLGAAACQGWNDQLVIKAIKELKALDPKLSKKSLSEITALIASKLSTMKDDKGAKTDGKESRSEKVARLQEEESSGEEQLEDESIFAVRQERDSLRKKTAKLEKQLKSQQGELCSKCGKSGHKTSDCKASSKGCFHCGEEGHFKNACPKRKSKS